MSFERYVDYALDVPMYFLYRDGKYIDMAGKSFAISWPERSRKLLTSRRCSATGPIT